MDSESITIDFYDCKAVFSVTIAVLWAVIDIGDMTITVPGVSNARREKGSALGL